MYTIIQAFPSFVNSNQKIFINILLIQAEFCHKNQGFRAFTRKIAERPKALLNFYKSEDNTDKSAAALVYYLFYRFLQLHTGICRHSAEFVTQTLVNKLVKRSSEYIGFPDF